VQYLFLCRAVPQHDRIIRWSPGDSLVLGGQMRSCLTSASTADSERVAPKAKEYGHQLICIVSVFLSSRGPHRGLSSYSLLSVDRDSNRALVTSTRLACRVTPWKTAQPTPGWQDVVVEFRSAASFVPPTTLEQPNRRAVYSCADKLFPLATLTQR
jgi:hypothetical protein